MAVIGGAGRTKRETALTHRTIEALKPEPAPYRVPDSRCPGLAIRVGCSGAKTFDLTFRISRGGIKRLSLGYFPDVPLEAARNRAHELTRAGRSGRDLIAEERATAADRARQLSVAHLIEEYAARELRGRKKTAKAIEHRLRRALTPKLQAAAEDLRRGDVRELLDSIADQGFEREAEKRRQSIRTMYRWAISRDLLEIDPTTGLKAYGHGRLRDRVLSDDEIHQLWEWLAAENCPAAHTDVLRFQLLTGARCSEVGGMMAEEVDPEDWLWVLPAARSKNARARATPLVGIAKEIVERRLPGKGPVFPAEDGGPLSSSHVGQILIHRRERLPIAHFTTHDLRRTFATSLDRMGIGLDLIAAILGHERANSRDTQTLVRHHLRTDKLERKRSALEAWDQRLREIVASGHKPDPKVVPMRQTG
jgi:integrase